MNKKILFASALSLTLFACASNDTPQPPQTTETQEALEFTQIIPVVYRCDSQVGQLPVVSVYGINGNNIAATQLHIEDLTSPPLLRIEDPNLNEDVYQGGNLIWVSQKSTPQTLTTNNALGLIERQENPETGSYQDITLLGNCSIDQAGTQQILQQQQQQQ